MEELPQNWNPFSLSTIYLNYYQGGYCPYCFEVNGLDAMYYIVLFCLTVSSHIPDEIPHIMSCWLDEVHIDFNENIYGKEELTCGSCF